MVIQLILACGVVALLYGGWAVRSVLSKSQGNARMQEIAAAIQEGARAYLNRQYRTITIVGAVIFVLAWYFLGWEVSIGHLIGATLSGAAGYIGMNVSVRANVRTAEASRKGIAEGLSLAFRSGAVTGLLVVGLGLLGVAGYYAFLVYGLGLDGNIDEQARIIQNSLVALGFGASLISIFARLGGGIFTKGADVGGDMVGKVEAGIPEDDPRNPATIADNVGDNVGDVAGMGADLYESYVGSIVGTVVLAVAAGLGIAGVTVPMIIASLGIIASIIGTFFVQTHEKADQKTLLAAIRRGIIVSAVLIAIVSYFVIVAVLGSEHIGVYFSVLAGLVSGVLIGISTEFFTSDCYAPTKAIAKSALTGPATVIIGGFGVGMLSTVTAVLAVAGGIWIAFWAAGGLQDYSLGLYGVGIGRASCRGRGEISGVAV